MRDEDIEVTTYKIAFSQEKYILLQRTPKKSIIKRLMVALIKKLSRPKVAIDWQGNKREWVQE